MRLDPYVVVIGARDRASRAAVLLRAGGYQVTKLADNPSVTREALLLQPDAVILDLPPLQANRLAQQFAVLGPSTPLLVVTSTPSLVHAAAISRLEIDSSLISSVDRMLADSVRVA
jgi:DNA-binding response OmpR family regulator